MNRLMKSNLAEHKYGTDQCHTVVPALAVSFQVCWYWVKEILAGENHLVLLSRYLPTNVARDDVEQSILILQAQQ